VNKLAALVSVIVPVYNTSAYLDNCIKSILNQSYQNFELILVNDGSTDVSDKICDSYSRIDDRVTVIHKKNEGVSVARNKGVEVAKGKYIQFVDSDDFLNEKMIEILMDEINQSNENVLPVCNINIYYEDEKYRHDLVQIAKSGSFNTEQYLLDFLLKFKTSPFIGSPCNKIFLKDIIIQNNIRFEEGQSFAEDFVFNLEYLYFVNKINIIDNSLYHYRLDTLESLTKNTKPVEYWWMNYKKIYEKYKHLFIHYGLYEKHYNEILLFMELATKVTIRKCFRTDTNLSINDKVEKIKYVWEDELVLQSYPQYTCEDKYMKTIRFLAGKKLYKLLGILLMMHSKVLDSVKKMQKKRIWR
jgi:glycosyltransferase involved in cell wall biosynthesis